MFSWHEHFFRSILCEENYNKWLLICKRQMFSFCCLLVSLFASFLVYLFCQFVSLCLSLSVWLLFLCVSYSVCFCVCPILFDCPCFSQWDSWRKFSKLCLQNIKTWTRFKSMDKFSGYKPQKNTTLWRDSWQTICFLKLRQTHFCPISFT